MSLSQFHLKLFGPLDGEQVKIRSLSVSEGLSTDYLIHVRCDAEIACVDPEAVIGQRGHVEMKSDDGVKTHFAGIYTDVAYDGIVDNTHQYRFVLQPALAVLDHNARYRIFQNMSAPDIVQKIFGERGVKFKAQIGGYPPMEYCVQYGEREDDFIKRLLEEFGIFYYFEHAPGGETLVLCDDSASLPNQSGAIEFLHRGDGSRRRTEISGFAEVALVRQAKYGSTDFNFREPRNRMQLTVSQGKQQTGLLDQYFVFPGRYRSMGEGTPLAKVRAEHFETSKAQFSCSHNAVKARPGSKLQMMKHPKDAYNREYLVLSSTFAVSLGDYRSTGTGHDGWTLEIESTLAKSDKPFRPPALTPRPRAYGLHNCRVVGPPGEEIYCDEHGRIKITFPWDIDSKDNEQSSCFVRVATPWAGPTRGFVAVPRIGDEVLVGFADGDPDRPLVCGSLYNGNNRAQNRNRNMHLSLRSRSTKGGGADEFNELRMEDSKGSERFYLQAQRDMEVLVKRNQKTLIKANEEHVVEKDRTVVVKGKEVHQTESGRQTRIRKDDRLNVASDYLINVQRKLQITVGMSKLTMEQNGKITLEGRDIEIKATSKATVKSMMTSVEGSVKAEVKGLMVNLRASAIATLNGALVKIG